MKPTVLTSHTKRLKGSASWEAPNLFANERRGAWSKKRAKPSHDSGLREKKLNSGKNKKEEEEEEEEEEESNTVHEARRVDFTEQA